MSDQELIIVTGFGPFSGHEQINPSWEAVRLLPKNVELNNKKYKILRLEVPVVYEAVDAVVEEIWQAKPKLVIHCGVDGRADCIKLEKCAANGVYCRKDFSGKCVPEPVVCLPNAGSSCAQLSTKLDLDRICYDFNSSSTSEAKLSKSIDIGSYLCGYIYLLSLDKCCDRCLFIHVPPISETYSPEETSTAIFNVIMKCVDQLN